MATYLDHAATTPVRPEVAEAMLPWLTGRYGNPSGGHAVARAARQAVEEARDELAEALGCLPRELVLTSGGTESDNLAIAGIGGTVACSAVEHHAVLDAVKAKGGTMIPVGADGIVDVAAVPGDVDLVSVMLVNNEVGTVQPVADVARRAGGLVHTDAVQALPWLDVAVLAADAHLVSVSAHKVGGPQGVGALVVREGVRLTPLLRGGGQERERRSGTHNVAGVVGFAAAVRACRASRPDVGGLRARLAAGLCAVPGVRTTVDLADTVPGILSVLIDGVESEALLVLLDRAGVCASAAASCASGAMEASHVLTALGVPGGGALRLSLGWTSTEADVDHALEVIPAAIEQLRKAAA
ncbi:MAG: Cysteine desulfurase [Actinomycetia bacterium]|nr:Cysteine desulfurase [Actinomycetes bacterium]